MAVPGLKTFLSFGLQPPLWAGTQHRHPTVAVFPQWASKDVPGDQALQAQILISPLVWLR